MLGSGDDNERREAMAAATSGCNDDPANAAPWFAVLSTAKAGNDRAAQDEALHRIVTARRSDQGYFTGMPSPSRRKPRLVDSWAALRVRRGEVCRVQRGVR